MSNSSETKTPAVTCLLCQQPLDATEVLRGVRMHPACGLKTTEYMWGEHANPDKYASYRKQMAQGPDQSNSSVCLIM